MLHSVVLITGGARSGKSRYAEERARQIGARLLYIATAEARDDEMARRIAEHRTRRGAAWTTLEEPVAIARTLTGRTGTFDAAVIDCVTLWLTNLMARGDEIYVKRNIEEFITAARIADAALFIVTNEVGAGIVPDNALARSFRDLAGRTNQRFAAAADEVVLMVAGLPVFIKRSGSCD